MRCPTLSQLPPPPEGKTGWPWTEETELIPGTMPDGSPWPKVSIVTPSYNQGQFLEETIRSVLLQGYPDLEYIIIDGGSTDGSVDVIRKYEPWLAHWVSEPDRGQSNAINKGWTIATGGLVGWLNSDDLYQRNALARIIPLLTRSPQLALAYGNCELVDAQRRRLSVWEPGLVDLRHLVTRNNSIPQQTTILRAAALEDVGALNEGLHYVMDYDLWVRILSKYQAAYVPETLASFRLHADSKSLSRGYRFWDEASQLFTNGSRRLTATLSETEVAAAISRMILKSALELTALGRYAEANTRLVRALTAEVAPFHDDLEFSDWILHYHDYGRERFVDTPANPVALFKMLRDIMCPEHYKHLRTVYRARFHATLLYESFDRGDYATARSHLMPAILADPRLLLNPGTYSLFVRMCLRQLKEVATP